MNTKNTFQIIACIIGIGLLMAYPVYEIYKKEKHKKYESEKQIIRQAYQQDQSSKIKQSNDNNAEFQVRKWYEECMRLHHANTHAGQGMLKEAQKTLLYWIEKREKELNTQLKEAKDKGETDVVKSCEKELKEISEMQEKAMK